MFDYPNSPTFGQTVTGANGQTYTWDNVKWVASGSGTAYAPIASPTFTGDPKAPTPSPGDADTSIATTAFVANAVAGFAPIASPVFTGDARAVTPSPGDNDTSVATTAFVGNALGGYATTATAANNAGRNRIHNCGFSINQRSYASGTALAAGAYGHDRWKAGAAGCTYTFTQNQPLTTITITAGSLQQVVEAMGVAAGTYTLSWTGTAQGRVNAGSYAASPVTAAGLPANTNITIEFNTGTLGAVQLEVGSVATPLDYGGSPQQILASCQRFYQIANAYYGGNFTGGNIIAGAVYLPVTMRAVPTATAGSGGSNANISGSPGYTPVSGLMVATTATVAATGFANVNQSITLSADL